MGDRLTLSLGARYDVEIIPTPNQDNPLFAGDPGRLSDDINNIAPRLGFSYALDGEGTIGDARRVRASSTSARC